MQMFAWKMDVSDANTFVGKIMPRVVLSKILKICYPDPWGNHPI